MHAPRREPTSPPPISTPQTAPAVIDSSASMTPASLRPCPISPPPLGIGLRGHLQDGDERDSSFSVALQDKIAVLPDCTGGAAGMLKVKRLAVAKCPASGAATALWSTCWVEASSATGEAFVGPPGRHRCARGPAVHRAQARKAADGADRAGSLGAYGELSIMAGSSCPSQLGGRQVYDRPLTLPTSPSASANQRAPAERPRVVLPGQEQQQRAAAPKRAAPSAGAMASSVRQ